MGENRGQEWTTAELKSQLCLSKAGGGGPDSPGEQLEGTPVPGVGLKLSTAPASPTSSTPLREEGVSQPSLPSRAGPAFFSTSSTSPQQGRRRCWGQLPLLRALPASLPACGAGHLGAYGAAGLLPPQPSGRPLGARAGGRRSSEISIVTEPARGAEPEEETPARAPRRSQR